MVVLVVVVEGAGIDTMVLAGDPMSVVVALPTASVIEKVDDLVTITFVEDEEATVVDTVIAHFVEDCCVMEEIVPPATMKS